MNNATCNKLDHILLADVNKYEQTFSSEIKLV